MKTGIYRKLMLGFAALACSAVANASIIYSNFDHEGQKVVDYRVVVDHDQNAGLFNVTYEVTNDASVKKLTGMFFNVSDQYNAGNLGLTSEFNPTNSSVCNIGFGVSRVTGGDCESNLSEGIFDVGLIWKKNDLTISPNKGGFSISDLGTLTLDSWGAIGIRAQAVDGNGSAKEVQSMADAPVAASEPGTIALIGLGFIGLMMSRKSQRKH